ncbi:tRNA lysidine(34) synthetase TilS [Phenylobacterium hankyongense]|uniref:tRNA(Ile)-lysidine synthase n=1 Tax=Phenylobacterium hankyongense TaxID=1813876 RepID=A0A328B493_9CAUL|nr:tRNA lysidine(34) synthetase TilS [Phenylobacterium hankyongense]
MLDERLLAAGPRPLAVAFSGGGDSLALLLAAEAWARRHGRELLALTVDHRLQPQSRAWTEACAATAARLGVRFEALAWEGEKPAQGLPAAARAARHRLLAAAARRAGARVILIGHTADDRLEVKAMRQAGSTTPDPRVWSPSPSWPEGRGVFLLRPLIGVRRAAIRRWLSARGEGWIDDPANDDPRFARARARRDLGPDAAPIGAAAPAPLELARHCRAGPSDGLSIARTALRQASLETAHRLVALAAVCAGGGDRTPGRGALDRVLALLRGDADVTATLAGARIEADGREVRFLREAGETARGGLSPVALRADEPAVWDGRFELTATRDGLEARALAGLSRRLPDAQRRALAALPAPARPGLPVVVDASGAVSCPLLADEGGVIVRSLVQDRLLAAAGLVEREPG